MLLNQWDLHVPLSPKLSSLWSQVFITSKIPPERMGFEETLEAAADARARIGRPLDCLLLGRHPEPS